jgi:FdhD protein
MEHMSTGSSRSGRPRVGISACLLGDKVRYDGGDKRNRLLAESLGQVVEWVRVCPEVEVGMGTPREPVHLVRASGRVRIKTTETAIDYTPVMQEWAARRLEELERENLSGYVLKKNSPSCGPDAVPIYDGSTGERVGHGAGLYADALLRRFPTLPIEDEDRLSNRDVRESFVRRVFEYWRARHVESTRRVSVTRVGRGPVQTVDDAAAIEEPLEVRLHGRPFAVIMRTPGADRELAAGFLLSEGVIRSSEDVGAIEHCRHPDYPDRHNVADVYLLGHAATEVEHRLDARRRVVATSSCGVCGRVSIDSLRTRAAPLSTSFSIDARLAAELPNLLRAHQPAFETTGGLHAAGIFAAIGACECWAEDVGRHNAVDKVIGRQLLDERLPARAILVVSGRTSFEIIQKAWVAGLELVCAVSAPSSLAIDLADAAGITLLGFARDGGFNVYTHPGRITGV